MTQELRQARTAQIAIVDDNDAVCRSLSLLLRAKGYGVSVYDSGLNFLNRSEAPEFDCVLIDFKMSPHDGFDLLREIRERGETMPAIMITGWQSSDLMDLARKAGFEDLIYKPMLDDKLIEALDQVLSH
ncbi:response regulator [Hyphomonas sp.]|uniref:response regulator n=1 Tax=Hyphomonas sp. TaxID=87 RepID=UPI0032ED61BF|tara:strand:+ start:1286 stop:1672 length:387 start_codon:yes stop_codon:yes gene_type:complete